MNKQLFLYLMTAVCLLLGGCKDKGNVTEEKTVPAADRTSLHENHLLGAVQSVTDTKYMVVPLSDGRDSLIFFSTKHDTYNEKGWLSGSVLTDADGDTLFVMKVTFDAKGHITLNEFFDGEGNRREYTEYQYDNKGFRVKESHYLNDSLTYEHVCTNDPNGNVEQITVNQGDDTYYMNYLNDNNGLPVRIVVTDHAGSFVKYKEEFGELVGPYANVVRRRRAFVGDFAAFAKAYVTGFERKLAATQAAYRARRRAFDDLFVHRPYDTEGSGAYRWSCVLARLDACDPAAVADLLRKAIEV